MGFRGSEVDDSGGSEGQTLRQSASDGGVPAGRRAALRPGSPQPVQRTGEVFRAFRLRLRRPLFAARCPAGSRPTFAGSSGSSTTPRRSSPPSFQASPLWRAKDDLLQSVPASVEAAANTGALGCPRAYVAGDGVAKTKTTRSCPLASRTWALKRTCPRSLIPPPGSTASVVPTPGITVPVPATKRRTPRDETYSPRSPVLRAAKKERSPALLRCKTGEPRRALTRYPPPGMGSPGRAIGTTAPAENRKTPAAVEVRPPTKATWPRLLMTGPLA